jgi:hypothetical protein
MLDIPALAQGAAATIVSAMATDAWPVVRTRLSRLFGGNSPDGQRGQQDELDILRDQLITAPATDRAMVARELQGELRGVLKTRLRDDVELAGALVAVLEDLAHQVGVAGVVTVNQHVVSGDGSIVNVTGGNAVNVTRPGWS